MREEPCGSHQVEARALKWETSEAFTEEVEGGAAEGADALKGRRERAACGCIRGMGRACRSSACACRSEDRIVEVLVVVCHRDCRAGEEDRG